MSSEFYQSAVPKSTKKEKSDFLFDLYPCLRDSINLLAGEPLQAKACICVRRAAGNCYLGAN
jgi:hypothetical protein